MKNNPIPQDRSADPIPQQAKVAIADGVARGDAVAELEYLGFPTRNINLLENSQFQITTLEQLVSRRPDELLEITNFGRNGLQRLLECLSRYDELDQAKRRTSKLGHIPATSA